MSCDNQPGPCHFICTDTPELTVQWLQLDSGREYSTEDIQLLHSSATSETLLTHRLVIVERFLNSKLNNY